MLLPVQLPLLRPSAALALLVAVEASADLKALRHQAILSAGLERLTPSCNEWG